MKWSWFEQGNNFMNRKAFYSFFLKSHKACDLFNIARSFQNAFTVNLFIGPKDQIFGLFLFV